MKVDRWCQIGFFLLLLSWSTTAIRWYELRSDYSYEEYCTEHQKRWPQEQYHMRKALFQQELARVMAHNALPRTWKEGINHFSDQTAAEKQAVLGAVGPLVHQQMSHFFPSSSSSAPSSYSFSSSSSSSFSSTSLSASNTLSLEDLPSEIDWRAKPGVLTGVKDQGKCGSCWAFGTTEVVESRYALKYNGRLPVLSIQQLVDCTPNPNSCGGTGGCGGSTAPLALQQLIKMGGQASEWTYPYLSYYGNSSSCHFSSQSTPSVAAIADFQVLTPNEPQPLLAALQSGPVIVNVDSRTWHAYEEGVYDGCNQTNPVINHIVVAVGYTESTWIVRNSWGPNWGEAGYIQLARDPLSQPCGTDLQPQSGIECAGGPSQVTVCGTCGITYSSVVPIIA